MHCGVRCSFGTRYSSGNSRLVDASEEDMRVEGTCRLKLTGPDGGRSTEAEALVSSSLKNDIFLSWVIMRELGVMPKDFPSIPADTCAATSRSCGVKDLVKEYEDVFGEDLSGGRCLRGTMKIHLKDGPITPKHVKYARRPPRKETTTSSTRRL